VLGNLAANGFRNYIASGGGRDFMRPISEFAYTTGTERALDQAGSDGWTVISVRNDWSTVF
jgi:hypothetical protein